MTHVSHQCQDADSATRRTPICNNKGQSRQRIPSTAHKVRSSMQNYAMEKEILMYSS